MEVHTASNRGFWCPLRDHHFAVHYYKRAKRKMLELGQRIDQGLLCQRLSSIYRLKWPAGEH